MNGQTTTMTPFDMPDTLDTLEPYVKHSGPMHEWQTVASLRSAVAPLAVVLHDVGPVQGWGTATFLDIDLETGHVRLGSAHDTEGQEWMTEAGFTRFVELGEGTPGDRFAEALDVAEREMPAVIAGFATSEDGMSAGLKTDEAHAAFLRIRAAVEGLAEEEKAE